jgi:hypothetical protein
MEDRNAMSDELELMREDHHEDHERLKEILSDFGRPINRMKYQLSQLHDGLESMSIFPYFEEIRGADDFFRIKAAGNLEVDLDSTLC